MSVPLRCRLQRWSQRSKSRFLVLTLLLCLLILLLFEFFSNHLRPVVETVAVSEATNLISVAVANVVEQCMQEQGLGYDDLMEIRQTQEDGIVTVTGRTTVISQLKSEIIQSLVAQLETLDAGQLGVPLGNLTGWMLFSGLGPKLRVSIDSVGDVTAQVRNYFESAGINQTHHQVLMDISATVHLFIPGEITSVTVEDTVCLAETILIGKVPDNYIQTGS
ncbi:sporulation protein YunB [Pseudoflavonifractor capillosus]|uniref:sporulation protein YunB n=1 Tax=Pseudoflavonifractor capillosus TaxID=106588 RepID=UPI00195890D9|nr:sporulation protein YunB [Pseudoflavonifractor capillosus]